MKTSFVYPEGFDQMTVEEQQVFTDSVLGIVSAIQDLKEKTSKLDFAHYSPYQLGIANGIIMAVSCFEGNEPQYIQPPASWLCNKSRIICVH